ncbi:GntR family transcriptional regulator [Clostridium sp. YIM B02515]|uniref:GntR family transcriptional regulator n=1 Tax=Clostridium rhizosphaerae TaxID=2803861 RepID=A0ABS1TGT5_9CLOT|nr:GntR family transcriptional regulator [Clostridium rhizosphaerae]MBL4938292.1 GntR family transcriptional regulator [Clostridium rhizosphaerae]
MKLSEDDIRPIYLQISEGIKDDILKGLLNEEDQVPSTNQLVSLYKINPATAAKGINTLVEEGIIYKKRGIGMFIASGAKSEIIKTRKKVFFDEYVLKLMSEAQKLNIPKESIIEMINDADIYLKQ